MGAQGIRRRKPKRRLPPVHLPGPDDDVPPNVMWPGSGSGFEAHPFSPAGRAQETWRLARALTGRRGAGLPVGRLVVGVLVIFAAAVLLAQVVSILF